LNIFLQQTSRTRARTVTAMFRHLGALGLFFLAILDSSPLPTFGGPDILIAILAGSHRRPWYEYAAAATAGSLIGACITYRIGRGAGTAYLHSKFGQGRGAVFLKFFQRSGTGTLIASTAIPFPFPTSMVFAAAGASGYSLTKYVGLVAVCRAARYSAIAIVADLYGRHFIRVLRHPVQYWGWFLGFAAVVAVLVAGGILINRRLAKATAI
jgi:membrane protein YqaA with SNARE-associated domain